MMKEWFYDISQLKSYGKQQQEFDDWISNARGCGIKEFEKCAKTFQSWRKEILNAIKYGITNGVTEGFNNKIKVLKRSSYGIRALTGSKSGYFITIIEKTVGIWRFIIE